LRWPGRENPFATCVVLSWAGGSAQWCPWGRARVRSACRLRCGRFAAMSGTWSGLVEEIPDLCISRFPVGHVPRYGSRPTASFAWSQRVVPALTRLRAGQARGEGATTERLLPLIAVWWALRQRGTASVWLLAVVPQAAVAWVGHAALPVLVPCPPRYPP